MADNVPLIKVVGTSASGKSSLVVGLRRRGYNARPASQEHSQTADMWQRIRPPDVLIYLHADLPAQVERRPDVPWSEEWLRTEEQRLEHARRHADLIVDTTPLKLEQVLDQVLAFLQSRGITHGQQPLPPLPETGGSHKQACCNDRR